ncbi:MAG: hypothetical protein MUC48_22125 [Leptolyngbya sp. Prado105]|jgi:hypothetical protein|nr:hypothetical protein [Leptolyngbya sp. Prado105]
MDSVGVLAWLKKKISHLSKRINGAKAGVPASPIKKIAQPESESTESIVSELTVDADGVGRCTIRGAARIVGIDQSSLTQSLKSAEGLKPTNLVEMLIDQGFSGEGISRFTRDGIPDRALSIIIQYYALDAGRYCTEQAKDAYKRWRSSSLKAGCNADENWV